METTKKESTVTYEIVVTYADGREDRWSVRDTSKGAKIALANAKRAASKYGFVNCEIREVSVENRNLSAAWSL